MVFFTCNNCGEALKKQAVEKHAWKCKREIDVSCMDCLKDFIGKAYDAHTSCITEEEKYSGKDYVPKANANKGVKKQEAWLDTIRSITENKKALSKGINEVFNVIRKNDNIPRKQKGFMNFFQNSAKHIRRNDVEAAWALLEEEVSKSKQANGAVQNGASGQANGTSPPNTPDHAEQKGFKKRKLVEQELSGNTEEPVKKKSKKKHQNGDSDRVENSLEADPTAQEGTALVSYGDKFKWGHVIRETLVTKGNQMKLSKLKKKVLKKYRKFTGENEISDKFDRKFSKKITKLRLAVDNDTVQLIE